MMTVDEAKEQARCIGFGEFERCENRPDYELNPAGLWCTRCEHLRRKTISASMEEIRASFKEARRA